MHKNTWTPRPSTHPQGPPRPQEEASQAATPCPGKERYCISLGKGLLGNGNVSAPCRVLSMAGNAGEVERHPDLLSF
ncbi:hypothetical protein NHX12_032846 [Muraenolepis orangiensis]|uniref:Uncharacterized protein n=1 Tax=Muraenolepis orangiensis TaxID=630683 RepID=A0A9Q0E2U4_9TELE|nr:hypothetical protein NHX12_032846 [Muraenolepis orangiensis]